MIQGEKQVNNMDRAAYQMLVPEYNQMRNILDLLDSTKDEDRNKWCATVIFHALIA